MENNSGLLDISLNSLECDFKVSDYFPLLDSQNGFLPNVFKVMANRPEEFRVFFAYHDVVMNKETGMSSSQNMDALKRFF